MKNVVSAESFVDYLINPLTKAGTQNTGLLRTSYEDQHFGNLILETSNTGTSKVVYVYDDSQNLIAARAGLHGWNY